MIDKKRAKSYCNEDICLVENYELAVNDETKTWHCHHRNEIMDDGTLHSIKWLKDNNLYYHRPASELIFLTHSEHMILHNKGKNNYMYGKHHSTESKQKTSKSMKGKYVSEETRKKLSGRKWMTNGSVTLRVKQNDINIYLSNGYRFGRK